ncbi:MAG TPA: acylphosphatase [Rhodanobacteraceae bacterium]|nr:acylphosphatase [Rhodanobacteraceae bacterium]
MSCVRFLVGGTVQGVFFRASAREQALRDGIDGWARNLPDGRVEVVAASADPAALDRLEAWLHHGPPAARVDHVARERLDTPPPPGFHVR